MGSKPVGKSAVDSRMGSARLVSVAGESVAARGGRGADAAGGPSVVGEIVWDGKGGRPAKETGTQKSAEPRGRRLLAGPVAESPSEAERGAALDAFHPSLELARAMAPGPSSDTAGFQLPTLPPTPDQHPALKLNLLARPFRTIRLHAVEKAPEQLAFPPTGPVQTVDQLPSRTDPSLSVAHPSTEQL